MKIKVIILTKNEQVHISRCIKSVERFASSILVIDSFSSDNTGQVAESCGAKVVYRRWQGYANQFNFAVKEFTQPGDWVLRIDADEIIDETSITELERLRTQDLCEFNGMVINRSIAYRGQILSGEPYYKVPIIRIFRSGFGKYEDRLMDEHLLIQGKIYHTRVHFIDNCLKGDEFFYKKHKKYARLEALSKGCELWSDQIDSETLRRKKNRNAYYRFPIFIRVFLLYIYFLILKKGFLRGKIFNSFLFKQVFLYRLWVDIELLKLRIGL